MINLAYSSKNGIVENDILNDFKGVLLRLKHSRKKGENKGTLMQIWRPANIWIEDLPMCSYENNIWRFHTKTPFTFSDAQLRYVNSLFATIQKYILYKFMLKISLLFKK